MLASLSSLKGGGLPGVDKMVMKTTALVMKLSALVMKAKALFIVEQPSGVRNDLICWAVM